MRVHELTLESKQSLQRIQNFGENSRHVRVGAQFQAAYLLTKMRIAMIKGVQFGLHGKIIKALSEGWSGSP